MLCKEEELISLPGIMAINIKNREADRLLAQLSARTGKGKSQLVLELLRREAARQARLGETAERRRRIEEISRRFADRVPSDAPSPEQIIGYDDRGLPR